MTLILALPAADGVALVSDTRKWLRTGSHVDGHQKLVKSRSGLVTGTGSGQLLDHVAAQISTSTFPAVISLITRVATCGVWDMEIADWTLTAERQSVCEAGADHGVGIVVFDGFSFKRTRWIAGSVPAGLPSEYLDRADARLRPIFDGETRLDELRTLVFDVYSDIYLSGLTSEDYDFGTHRPGCRLSIERVRVRRGAAEEEEARTRPARSTIAVPGGECRNRSHC